MGDAMMSGVRRLRQNARTALSLGVHAGRMLLSPAFRRNAVPAEAAKAVADCARWLEDYMGQPHAQLGRNGEICPYVKAAMRKDHVSYSCYDGVTALGARGISEIFLFEGRALERLLDPTDVDVDMTSICVLFPQLRQADFENMTAAHVLAKGVLMSRGLMLAVFYPGHDKQGIYNPAFKLYQSPFPIAAIRPMAVRDIAFVDFNREAFEEYRRRFGKEFADEKVSNKFGHVDRFREAEKRFSA
jgi:tryptophan 2,3-dioxygenase